MDSARTSNATKNKSRDRQKVDGSNLIELVRNEEVFTSVVDHKFHAHDTDKDGQLSVKTLQLAVADIGAAPGLPAQGSSPDSDHIYSEVTSNIVEPAVQSCGMDEHRKPVIVARRENTFNGSAIKRLFSSKLELEKTMNAALEKVPEDSIGKLSKDYLRVALDTLAPSAGLPPLGAVGKVAKIVDDVGKIVKEEEFKKILTEILGSIMLQIEENPIYISANSVVHEPFATSSSTVLQPSS